MSSKTLVKNSTARIEAELNNEEVTEVDYLAKKVINPDKSVVGKSVIINLPMDVDYTIITKRNKVISRFPLQGDGLKYELVPYPEVEFSNDLVYRPYSSMILNRWMMLDPDYIVTLTDRYLLGIDPVTNGEFNCIGYMLERTIKR